MGIQGLIAKKIGMTRIVNSEGQVIPVTLLKVEEQQVTKVLNKERDGYYGYQIGYYVKPEHRLNKPDLTRLRKAGVDVNFARFKEIRCAAPAEGLEIKSLLSASLLEGLKSVDVTGITKGRGFEGSITRWGHSRGRMTHGSNFRRKPGSLGMRATPGRVFKNKGQPGHMGFVQRTIQNLQVVDVDKETNVIALKGSVPGHRDGFLIVKPSIKAK